MSENNTSEIEHLISKTRYGNNVEVHTLFKKISKDDTGRGKYYSISHTLAQAAFASTKSRRIVLRKEEPGEKCHMCGEFEVLHAVAYSPGMKASDYKEHITQFWTTLRTRFGEFDFDEHEKLCSLCTMKRLAAKVLKSDSTHILRHAFESEEGFPSTTELALSEYFERENIANVDKKKKIAQKLHDNKSCDIDSDDLYSPYYAILLMDGDNMGKLVGGEGIPATWKSILHPDLSGRFQRNDFSEVYRETWQKIFKEYPQRLLTPSIHAAISESLGDFALYGVAPIIERYKGKLIYAGGDDVCAVMPKSTVIQAAREIRDYYHSTFRVIDERGKSSELKGKWKVEKGKLSINLGKGEGISISAGILICHHKENLRDMIVRSHEILEHYAKAGAGKDACALVLRKRAGGERMFVRKWGDDEQERGWDSFLKVVHILNASEKKGFSTSLFYGLESFRTGIEAALQKGEGKKIICGLFSEQIKRAMGGIKKENVQDLSELIYDVVIENRKFNPEALEIAAYFAKHATSQCKKGGTP